MNKLRCILLIDDDPVTNFVNQMLLEDLQVTEQVLVAHNGKDALELIKKAFQESNCPQLILLDINMPVMNGFEFLKAYEKLEIAHKQSVMIVMLTTSLNPKDVDMLKEAPIEGFLNKPLTKEMVQELLRTHFNRPIFPSHG